MQIQCPKCSGWTDAESNVCQLCGASLNDGDTQKNAYPETWEIRQIRAEARRNKENGVFFIIFIAVCILIVILNIFL